MEAPAVPGDVDEADEAAGIACADPAQAVASHPVQPIAAHQRVVEALRVQRVDLVVAEVAAPLVVDRHGASVGLRPGRLRAGASRRVSGQSVSAAAVARTKPGGLSSMMLWPQSGTGTTDTPARVSASAPARGPSASGSR
ncbi:hypothetical protein SCALM49S_08608 [Streptomyces californicus]